MKIFFQTTRKAGGGFWTNQNNVVNRMKFKATNADQHDGCWVWLMEMSKSKNSTKDWVKFIQRWPMYSYFICLPSGHKRKKVEKLWAIPIKVIDLPRMEVVLWEINVPTSIECFYDFANHAEVRDTLCMRFYLRLTILLWQESIVLITTPKISITIRTHPHWIFTIEASYE